jgi:hypothetical protein
VTTGKPDDLMARLKESLSQLPQPTTPRGGIRYGIRPHQPMTAEEMALAERVAKEMTPSPASLLGLALPDCQCGHPFASHDGTPPQDLCAGGTPGFCGCTSYRPQED